MHKSRDESVFIEVVVSWIIKSEGAKYRVTMSWQGESKKYIKGQFRDTFQIPYPTWSAEVRELFRTALLMRKVL